MAEWSTYNGTVLTYGGNMLSPVDTYNPLGLPPYTIRCKFITGYTPTMGDSQTLVDSDLNVWDIVKSSNNWDRLFLDSGIQDVLGANTSMVTSMEGMFGRCISLTSVSPFDTGSVMNMHGMFAICRALTTVPLFDTRSVTDMESMFDGCSVLTTVPLFDTRSVTNMSYMFFGCHSLTTVPLFDTHSVTNMRQMFSYCYVLTTVPLFDTHSVTDMLSMFDYCYALTTVPPFDTRIVTSMGGMFYMCDSLSVIPSFSDLSSLTACYRMFYDCRDVNSGILDMYNRLKDIPGLNHEQTFYNCGIDSPTGSQELARIPSDWK